MKYIKNTVIQTEELIIQVTKRRIQYMFTKSRLCIKNLLIAHLHGTMHNDMDRNYQIVKIHGH